MTAFLRVSAFNPVQDAGHRSGVVVGGVVLVRIHLCCLRHPFRVEKVTYLRGSFSRNESVERSVFRGSNVETFMLRWPYRLEITTGWLGVKH